jgi:hypothetical protein
VGFLGRFRQEMLAGEDDDRQGPFF